MKVIYKGVDPALDKQIEALAARVGKPHPVASGWTYILGERSHSYCEFVFQDSYMEAAFTAAVQALDSRIEVK